MDLLSHSPAAGFDHPLEILDGCHERIRRQCRLIAKIAGRLAASGPDADTAQAARDVTRFFDIAGAHHHRDEEDDVFPALERFAPSAELNAVRALLHRLRDDHAKLDGLWARMRSRLAEIADGGNGGLDAEAAERFARAYEEHIALEESAVLPLARRVFDDRYVERLGRAMARRRGVCAHPAA